MPNRFSNPVVRFGRNLSDSKQVSGVGLQGARQHNQLNNIDPPLAALNPRDK